MSESHPAGLRWPWPTGPIFTGHVYQITNPTSFFLPILAGQVPPQQGYAPWPGLEVRTWSVNDLIPIPLPGGTAGTQADGSFSITQPPPNATVPGGTPSDVRFMLLYQKDRSRSVPSTARISA